jgi:hypothetical protein
MSRHAKSLLERAQELKTTRSKESYSPERLELVRAWLDGIVTITQVMRVLNCHAAHAYTFVARGARILHQQKGGE